jgi:L-glutamine-phosphate cytidylyltransferase
MKIIILAAGRGERLMPLTQNTPKPLIDIGNGNTLLEEQMVSIQEAGVIDEIVLVVGYLADQIEAKMRTYNERGFQIRTVYNPFWKVSNNLLSLWLAKHVIAESDVMITNGDNIFTPKVFRGLAEQKDGIWLSVCKKNEFDQDDMKVKIVDGIVTSVSKKTPGEEAVAESPGLVMVKGERARQLFNEQLEGTVRDDENNNRFWLEVFNRMWNKGVQVRPWMFESAGNWQEIDFHVDVSLMRELLATKMLPIYRQKIKS